MTISMTYEIAAIQRVSAGKGAEVRNERTAHGVLPGSTVRGALAAAWLREKGTSEAFVDLFERHLTTRQAVPDNAELRGMSEVTCKYPGDGCPTGWYDRAADVLAGRAQASACPVCRGAVKPGRGWDLGRGLIASATRVELDENGVAVDERLFTRAAVRSGTRFTGTLVLTTDSAAEWLSTARELRIGGQRSVLGAAAWTACLDGSGSAVPRIDGTTVLRLRSPAVIVDKYGAPTSDITAVLDRLFPSDAVLRASWTRPVRVSGWHMASGLPKPDEWALDAGSTFVVEGLPDDAAARLAHGIGLRRREGYGEIEVCDVASAPWAEQPTARLSAPAPKSPAGPPAPGPLDPLVGSCPPARLRAVLAGLRDGLRTVGQYRDYRMGESRIADLVEVELARPWARGLDAATTTELRRILGEPDYVRWLARVTEAQSGASHA
ncbi:MAG: hypothetical protein DLM58_07505 [Pseudonocardiales bacterium]|nr:MAG: hypothetical protein DLM58_07505 [Pseudonocardiales bacterium]